MTYLPDEVRTYLEKVQNIAEYNIQNNQQYSEYWKQLWKKWIMMMKKFSEMSLIVNSLKRNSNSLFEANKQNSDVLKYILVTLKKQECADDDPFMAEVDAAWKVYAKEFNQALQDSLEKANPALAANRLANEGKYSESVKKYQQAINEETDPEKKANYYYAMAAIQFAHLSQYSTARTNAQKAGQLKQRWGKPYILIGDMYSKTSKSCGDDWNKE